MARRETPRRICIAPIDIASYYSGLRQGFVELGIPCWFFSFDDSPYSRYRPAADALWLERLIYALMHSSRLRSTAAGRGLRTVLTIPLRLIACIMAAVACDVFVFAFSRTLLKGIELPFLRLLGRKIVFVFNGSDTRPAWMSGIFVCGAKPDMGAILRETRRQRRQLRWIERWASALVCHPLSAQLLRRPFINHLQIGHPCAPTTLRRANRAPGSPLRLLHAPTRPLQKGSDLFRRIVGTLRREGHVLDYQEITGRPNHEVLAAISSCDLVLDETYSDIPLAGLGSEAAFAGIPAIVGGYGGEEIVRFSTGTGLPTDAFAHPDQLGDLVRRFVLDPELRRRQGEAAQRFLTDRWSPSAVAGRFIQAITGNAPTEWIVDPTTLIYWAGWGAPEEQIRATVTSIVKVHGPTVLGIGHNLKLEASLSTAPLSEALRDASTTAG